MTTVKKPAWAKRMDAINFTVLGIIMIFIGWETVARLLQ